MQTSSHRYSDPTGGGDDIVLTIPGWVTPPRQITVTDPHGEFHTFDYDDEEASD